MQTSTKINSESSENFKSFKKEIKLDICAVDEPQFFTDKRKKSFTMIDNAFVKFCFDPFTTSLYLRMAMIASNNERGFFESIETTAEAMGISIRQIKASRKLLSACHIITITPQFRQDGSQTSSVIFLNDESIWDLDHTWKHALKFDSHLSKLKKIMGIKISEQAGLHLDENGKNIESTVHPPRAHHAPPPCTPCTQTIPKFNKTDLKQKNNVCVLRSSKENNTITCSTHTQEKKKNLTQQFPKILPSSSLSPVPTSPSMRSPTYCHNRSLTWALSDILRAAFPSRQNFVSNDDCAEIIADVIQHTGCTETRIRKMLHEIIEVERDSVFSSQRFNLRLIKNDFANWIHFHSENSATAFKMQNHAIDKYD